MALALLAVVPQAFLVIDRRLAVKGWNAAAASLLSFAGSPPPPVLLAKLLQRCTAVDAVTRSIIVSRVEQVVQAASASAAQGEALESVAVPLGDAASLFCVRQVGPRRWLLLFEASPKGNVPAGELASVDPLTGLRDRRAFNEMLQQLMLAALGQKKAHVGPSLIMLDLDRFKETNDRFGQSLGDALLTTVAQRLRGAVRESDLALRLGADRFALLSPVADGAEVLAGRLVDLLGRTYLLQGQVCNISASIGIATASADGSTSDELVRSAELALGHAKAEGRGRHCLFRPELDVRARARHGIEIGLRRALVLRQLELHYQPQVNIGTNQLVGFEALLRWRDPERGIVPPMEFIPIAEQLGLMVPFGEWVLRTACRECAGWPDPLTVAVNVSPLQLDDPGRLVRAVASALRTAGLPPHRLEIEITESTLLRQEEAIRAVLHELRDMGVRLSMDDFGTGYSSLSQLRSFPFDKIKIDRSFVRDLPSSNAAMAVVRAIAALGTSLGMTTTAEGVETAQQAAQVGAEGCTYMQGYLVSKPVCAAELAPLIVRYASDKTDSTLARPNPVRRLSNG